MNTYVVCGYSLEAPCTKKENIYMTAPLNWTYQMGRGHKCCLKNDFLMLLTS